MNDKERRFILGRFSEYYKSAQIAIPEIEKREFGIGLQKKIDIRHLSFDSTERFRNYLVNNTPLFVSHSTAYYSYPDATPIEKKSWRGADLVFDLDAHSEEKFGVYRVLEKIKSDAITLAEEFLMADFGMPKNDIVFVFSGNRGYHVHSRDRNYYGLGGEERREIASYIRGDGLKYENFFGKEEIKRGLFRISGPKPDEQGYRGRFARAVIKKLEAAPKEINRKFGKDEKEKEMFISGINEGNWSKTSVKDIITELKPIGDSLPLYSVNADASVSYDLSKLIRVPNSIHGETGLIAKIIEANEMEKFEPLRDAMLKSEKEIRIKFIEDIPAVEMNNSTYSFRKEDAAELPESVAIFFVLKGSGEIVF